MAEDLRTMEIRALSEKIMAVCENQQNSTVISALGLCLTISLKQSKPKPGKRTEDFIDEFTDKLNRALKA